ncbi:mitotic checkpoint serine/threonine-protein kinase BUB1 isoform X1 [Xiphophorus hellerii]|uniref:mitotic checkpoint serine/threonine-protein kinase BUB1 isoform X1 n=1 Tax=Xiphophorus hellerii TaxID=8084 RepID=UPI0013B38F3F|nr:mitotic checkpoint serine/threonine-protein kinase BUB1 isoform X1 [Xiphophorus hellerii]
MDIASYLRCFEESLASYSGDDPLDPWDRFVDFLEQRQPAGGSSEMSVVFNALVQRFLNVDQYANDVRYVNYCIRCASYCADPATLYAHVFSRGVGSRTAALYLAWARHFEQKGMKDQADAVYLKALENQAQPADTLLHEYRQFQSRTRTEPPASGARVPLQNSQLTNQMSPQKKAAADSPSKLPLRRTVTTVSRPETSGTQPSSQDAAAPTVSEYSEDALVHDGVEFCFEEVRAEKYFRKIRERQEWGRSEKMQRQLWQQEQEVQRLQSMLQQVNQSLQACGGSPCTTLQASAAPFIFSSSSRSRRSVGRGLLSDLSLIKEAAGTGSGSEATRLLPFLSDCSGAAEPQAPGSSAQRNPEARRPGGLGAAPLHCGLVPEPEEKLDVSQGGAANVSHVTPNSSLGFVQATPSRALPSPTVNTREALGVIMNMFQAPTFLDDPFQGASMLHPAAAEPDPDLETGVVPLVPEPPAAAPFTIFQDFEDKENGSAAVPFERSKPARALTELGRPRADRPNETPSELIPDESTMWGARHNSLAACPNSTTDFAPLAQFVSTPFTHKTPFSGGFFLAEENNGDGGDADENVFIRWQTNKLSPIMEQSPADDAASEAAGAPLLPSSARQGTIMADGFGSSCLSMTQPPPPALLSFRDQTLCPAEASGAAGWEASPMQNPLRPSREPFQILEDPERPGSPEPDQNLLGDVPMSPQCAPTASRLDIRSPDSSAEPDLDAFLSPCRPSSARTRDVPMSPAAPGGLWLVSNPWDADRISDLLSRLRPPLTSHPCCYSWPCAVPSIGPKNTLSLGSSSLRVDAVLGQGAFATVFQATDPATSDRMVLKVQKPANPWEFYINTCLDARLPPSVRHLLGSIRSAHLFLDGSIMLGELHNYGTLLNAVNLFRAQSVKVMPPPLVLHFAVCILHTVEQLHAAHIIHADIKPDNFLLGERFLENRCFDADGVDHGLVLIDLGQSIDMALFPECTAFTARCLTSGFQCTEMLSGKPWSYQTDYFGIAGTVYCLLFGTYMQVVNEGGVWQTNGIFRRKPHADLWLDFFHTLLNVPDCGALPSLQGLRRRLAAVLQQHYRSKLATLKSHLVVQLMENHRARR